MDEEWDADNFTIKKPSVVNKWEGEDEDDDVKDSWDAEEEEEEEKKDDEKVEPKPKPSKKTLADRIAEKERLRQEEIERKIKEMENEMSEEEKLRQQKESDLQLALDTTFGLEVEKTGGLDGMQPTTKEEFAEFSELLNKKFLIISRSSEFPAFAEDHIRNVCASLNSGDLKKLKITIENMYIEKQKIEKGEKPKKSKGKTKVKLRVEDGNTRNEYSAYGDFDDYDDFM